MKARLVFDVQPCGYYALQLYLANEQEKNVLSFVEDATAYRLSEDSGSRLQR